MSVANQNRVRLDALPDGAVEEVVYAVFNDETIIDELIASGKLHPVLRDQFMKPLYDNVIPGPALRYARWTNEQRAQQGKIATNGRVLLREQRVIRYPWRTITDEEMETIDDGRRANG